MDLVKRCVYREQEVDEEYEGIVRQLMTYMMEDSRTIPSVPDRVILRSFYRAYRRRRCQNICEYIFYFVKGRISEITSAAMSWI